MVPLKSRVSGNFGMVSKSRRFLCYVSKSHLPVAFSVSELSWIFSRKVSVSRILLRASQILSDQTHIYLKDIVFGPQNI